MLLRGRDIPAEKESVELAWRVKLREKEARDITLFSVPSSDRFEMAANPVAMAKQGKALYARQQKALQRMLDIEAEKVTFEEYEHSQHLLPAIGWTLEAKARREQMLGGGVLADAMGAGKTVTAIALIASKQNEAHVWFDKTNDSHYSRATLVVTPPNLVGQWNDMRKDFTGNALKCETISNMDDLKKITCKQMR